MRVIRRRSVAPWRHERRSIDIVLCPQHDEQFQTSGLMGVVTAYGDLISEDLQ